MPNNPLSSSTVYCLLSTGDVWSPMGTMTLAIKTAKLSHTLIHYIYQS